MTAPQPATPGSDSVRAQIADYPCQCHRSHAAVLPFHAGHCCFFPATATCHSTEVAAWSARAAAYRTPNPSKETDR